MFKRLASAARRNHRSILVVLRWLAVFLFFLPIHMVFMVGFVAPALHIPVETCSTPKGASHDAAR